MADVSICSIECCGKKTIAKGLCGKHYQRLRNGGDPNKVKFKRASDGEPLAFYKESMKYEGDECIIWPFAKAKGYAKLFYNGKLRIVSRLVCEEANGPPPSVEYDAAHTCGFGAGGCVTKSHIVWKTHLENNRDKIEHGTSLRGTKHNMAKLTEENVREIRSLRGTMTGRAVASKFNISDSMVSMIQKRNVWGWLE